MLGFQNLGESITGISQNAKDGELERFGKSVESAGKAVCGLTEAAAQVITKAQF